MKISSYTASGLATGTMPSMSLSVKGMNGTTKITQKSSSQNKKKKLNYNPREISSAILRANKSQSAGRVAVQAKSKLINLQKCKGTGQYDEGELNLAIAHAKRMVQCAKMKTQNLRQEERSKKRYEKEAKAELRQEKNEIKARVARKERNLEQKSNIEHMQRVQKQKSQKRELMRKKKFHRSQEQSKLNEADMNYLKQQLRGLREPYSASRSFSAGVAVDLSAEAMRLAEVQMEQQLAEAQIEQQIAQQMAVGMGEVATMAGNGGSAAPAASVTASIDVVI